VNLRQRYQAITGRSFPEPAALPDVPAPLPGSWNPRYIDLTRDAADWLELDPAEQEFLLGLIALCQAGDEGVALSLLPLMMVKDDEQRLEEELSLTSFLWEEAKHVEIFRRFFREVAPDAAPRGGHRTIAYCGLVHNELPAALQRLRQDASPAAQADALAAYDLIVVGMLAETGYRAYATWLDRGERMPGMRSAVEHLSRDASRHLEASVMRLAGMVAEHGAVVRDVIEHRTAMLLGPALDVIEEAFTGSARPDAPAFAARAALRLEGRLTRIL
jgi:ribonucleoside-diphosphate reductase beta chain